jgi:UDPglucose--hexose-1-phosphate uridylyltransferase
MPELRQNPATKEWVIISAERAMRPNQMGKAITHLPTNEKEMCPFCPGHEDMTPDEILSYRTYGTAPNSPGWRIRIVPNKYAALVPKGELKRDKKHRFFPQMNGIGEHEVIIESPEHEKTIATMDQKQVEEIFLAYRERYLTLTQNPKYEMIILFKNHGIRAGTSLKHPHSQLIATPITPMHIRHRIEEAMRHFDDNGECVYCEMIKTEKKAKERVVLETDNFITFEPFASRSPFETWVIPKIHKASFEEISLEEIMENIITGMYKFFPA